MKIPSPLIAALDALEQQLPQLMLDYPDPAEFWPAFSELSDPIEERTVNGADLRYVLSRIDTMLAQHGRQILRIDVGRMGEAH